MHIEIDFTGTVTWQAEQYMQCLEQVQEWAASHNIEVAVAWANGQMLITMPNRADYLLWIATQRMTYQFNNQAHDPL